jgi:hypothetical protein
MLWMPLLLLVICPFHLCVGYAGYRYAFDPADGK